LKGWGVANRGVSFGLSAPAIVWYLAYAMVMLLGGYKTKLLLAGAVGNMLSRVILGYVWDYIKIPYIELWFNFSDIMIVLASIFIIWKSK